MFDKINLESLNLNTSKADQRTLSFLSDDINEAEISVCGYADDEGIRNNSGRLGAKEAPNKIREFLYKMTPPAFAENTTYKNLYDLGNLKLNDTLAQRHENAVQFLSRILDQNKSLVSFGGGHDYGYVDGQSFLNFCSDKAQRPIIINFDAHLDVRPVVQDKISSGTPFYRLLQSDVFDFVEIGLQEQCNSKDHLTWLEKNGGKYLSLQKLYSDAQGAYSSSLNFEEFKKAILPYIKDGKKPCYLSVDIDAFANAYAPGCSQSFATGLEPQGFFKMFDYLIKTFDVRVLGIYEVSPPLDFDDHTSKLAAQIAYKFIYS